MPEKLVHLFGCFPFVVQAITEDGKKSIKMNWARLMEAGIIGTVGALVTSYLMLRDLNVKFDEFKDVMKINVTKIEMRIDKMDDRLYDHMAETNNGLRRDYGRTEK